MKSKKNFLALMWVIIIIALAFAANKVTVPNRAVAHTAISSSQFNANLDTMAGGINQICDTLNNNVPRYTQNATTHDKIIPYLRVDTIRSNPSIDSIAGNPWINVVNTDSIRSRSGLFTGVLNSDSAYYSTGMRTSNGTFTGTLTATRCERGMATCTLSAGPGVTFSMPDGTVDTTGYLYWTKIGGMVSGYLYSIRTMVTIADSNVGSVTIRNFPAEIASVPFSFIPIESSTESTVGRIQDTLGSRWILCVEYQNAYIRGVREGGGAKTQLRYVTFTYYMDLF